MTTDRRIIRTVWIALQYSALVACGDTPANALTAGTQGTVIPAPADSGALGAAEAVDANPTHDAAMDAAGSGAETPAMANTAGAANRAGTGGLGASATAGEDAGPGAGTEVPLFPGDDDDDADDDDADDDDEYDD